MQCFPNGSLKYWIVIQGDIVTCSINLLSVHTVNGHHIASLRLAAHEPIFSLAMHERETSLMPILACGSINGLITLRTWNANDTSAEETQARWKVTTVRQLKLRREMRDGGSEPSITALEFVG